MITTRGGLTLNRIDQHNNRIFETMNALRLALIVAVLSFQSCIYSKMTHLSDKDLEWVDVYEVGDTVLFVSNHGNTDIMIVTDKFLYNDRCPFYISEGRGPNYEANMGYDYIIRHGGINIDGGILLKKNIADSLELILNFGNRFLRFNSNDICGPLQISVCTYDNMLYNDCIIADSVNSGYSDYWKEKIKNKVEKFVWSKEYGLIYYKFEDGEEFFLKDFLPDSVNDITN